MSVLRKYCHKRCFFPSASTCVQLRSTSTLFMLNSHYAHATSAGEYNAWECCRDSPRVHNRGITASVSNIFFRGAQDFTLPPQPFFLCLSSRLMPCSICIVYSSCSRSKRYAAHERALGSASSSRERVSHNLTLHHATDKHDFPVTIMLTR